MVLKFPGPFPRKREPLFALVPGQHETEIPACAGMTP